MSKPKQSINCGVQNAISLKRPRKLVLDAKRCMSVMGYCEFKTQLATTCGDANIKGCLHLFQGHMNMDDYNMPILFALLHASCCMHMVHTTLVCFASCLVLYAHGATEYMQGLAH